MILAVTGPLFILGSPRSGTTAISTALSEVTGFAMKGEGHVWPLLLHLEQMATRYSDGVMDLAGAAADLELASFIEKMAAELPAIFAKHYEPWADRWIDKTPGAGMLEAVPRLSKLYPGGKFILMKRHPIEAVRSMQRRFPDRTFQAHCANWASTYETWLRVKNGPKLPVLEIEQADLILNPREAASTLSHFLVGDESLVDDLLMASGQRGIEQTAHPSIIPSIDTVDWTNTEKEDFIALCEDTATGMGYSIRQTIYRDTKGVSSLFWPRVNTSTSYTDNINNYCYPIKGGFQLCPNVNPSYPVTISYRNVAVEGGSSLSFGYAREFANGPDLSISIDVRHASKGDLISHNDVPARITAIADASIYLGDRGGLVDIDIQLCIPAGQTPDHGTIFLYRPLIVPAGTPIGD